MPSRDSRPNVGLKPTTPQNAAGRMTEPFVWLPTASGTTPAATAAAEPMDEPPAELARRREAAGLAIEQFDVMKIGETRSIVPERESPGGGRP